LIFVPIGGQSKGRDFGSKEIVGKALICTRRKGGEEALRKDYKS